MDVRRAVHTPEISRLVVTGASYCPGMQSVQDPSVSPSQVEGAPTMTDGAEAWSELCAALSVRAKLDARIVSLAGRVCARHPALRPATPLFTGLVDLKDLSVNAAGMLQINGAYGDQGAGSP